MYDQACVQGPAYVHVQRQASSPFGSDHQFTVTQTTSQTAVDSRCRECGVVLSLKHRQSYYQRTCRVARRSALVRPTVKNTHVASKDVWYRQARDLVRYVEKPVHRRSCKLALQESPSRPPRADQVTTTESAWITSSSMVHQHARIADQRSSRSPSADLEEPRAGKREHLLPYRAAARHGRKQAHHRSSTASEGSASASPSPSASRSSSPTLSPVRIKEEE